MNSLRVFWQFLRHPVESFWWLVAGIVARPSVAAALIRRATRTPYSHLYDSEGRCYMQRYWLFNPYPDRDSGSRPWWRFPWSIRMHYILKHDTDPHLHDHPWNCRSIILRGWYMEVRLLQKSRGPYPGMTLLSGRKRFARLPGSTAAIAFEQFHKIDYVSPGGCWTLFITGPYRGEWGFLTPAGKIPWRKYLGIPEKQPKITDIPR